MTEHAFRYRAFRPMPDRLAVMLRVFARRLRLMRQRRRSRARLAELDAYMLRDIGLTETRAEREVRRSFPWHMSFPWRDAPRDPWR